MKDYIYFKRRVYRKRSRSSNSENNKMPCKDFSPKDIVCICSEIARSDNIQVQDARKKSFFRRSSSELDVPSLERKSSIARKLSLVNGIPTCDASAKTRIPESPTIDKFTRKFSVDSNLDKLDKTNKRKETIPGLRGRDVVAVAILVNDKGLPIKTYTENQDIPGEEIEAANHIFMSRVPVQRNHPQSDKTNNNNSTSNANIQALANVLTNLDNNKQEKMMKKLDKTLAKLHTTDLTTALSFLKVDRYADVRREIKAELLLFVTKDLKMVVL